MSIKTIQLKKKLEKTASPMELFVAQQLYDVLDKLVQASHEDNATKVKELAEQLAGKLKEMYQRIDSALASHQEKAIAQITKHGEKSQIPVNDVVAEIKAKSEREIKSLMDNFSKICDKMLAEIDRKVGPQGIQGKPGTNGKNGSPDTAEQVVTKVNKAKGVKIDAIDGLSEQLKSIKKGAGGGKTGGGMGNVLHETKSVGSATTSVTTTYPIAANGRACWLCYQGQALVYGTHYTVNRNIITLTFDKVDSTFIDITYIRGS